MVVVSVTLPSELLRDFGEFMKKRGYYSRSEAFRDALRSLMTEAEVVKAETGDISAIIMASCEIDRRDTDLRLSEIRHEFDDIVVENMHRHVRNKHCLEIFVAEGNNKRILDLVGRLRGMRGIQQAKVMFISLS
ncbi:MAG: CopG family ribbon-helix-helix protein [archaeon]